MKRRFLPMLLLMLIGVTGNMKALAQVPEPDGQWTFSNPGDLMAASKGSLTLSTAVIGQSSITDATIDEAGIDMILVGDSLGNVMLGYENTLAVTVDDMIHHGKAVCRGAQEAFVVTMVPSSDSPFVVVIRVRVNVSSFPMITLGRSSEVGLMVTA